MAIQNMGICDMGPDVNVSLDWDDATMLVVDVNYQNLSSKDARLTLTISGTPHDEILPAGTARTTKDISGLGIHMVAVTPPKGDPTFGLPSNIQVNCAWPAA
jgi:hypothetical protein